MKKRIFPVLLSGLLALGILYSCSGGSGSSASNGTVGMYLTDDMSLLFTQVTATIDRVQLFNTGSGTSCDLLASPLTVNIANMANVMQLADASICPAGSYNRFRVQFDKNVQLLSGSTGTPSSCSFTSYMNTGNGGMPNVLNCDPGTGVCSLDVNGAVNVFATQDNKLGLDFDLKNFSVTNLGMPDCAVTMKVSPMTPGQMQEAEAVTGLVSGLSTTNMTFGLTRGTRTFNVYYSGITDAAQPDLSTLLQRAQDDGLRTMVTASTIDLPTNTITASSIEVKAEGTVSNLTGTAFVLLYGSGKTLNVDFSNAVISGTVADGSWVNVKLVGHDLSTGNFIADKIEVESAGMTTVN